MLSDRERRVLGDVERRTAAEDPEFANALRDGSEQLPRAGGPAADPALLGPLAVIVIILLLMGQLTTAVIIASLAAGIGWFAGRPGRMRGWSSTRRPGSS